MKRPLPSYLNLRTRRTYVTFLCLFVGFSIASCSYQTEANPCTAENYVETAYQMSASQEGEHVTVTLDVELINAAAPQPYRLLAFLDEAQVAHGVKPFTLGCGERKTLTFALDSAGEAHTLNVFLRRHPLLPKVLEGETPQSLPEDFSWIDLTHEFNSVDTVTLSSDPLVYSPTPLPITYVESRFAPSRFSYIFLDDLETNVHVQTLAADAVTSEFNLYFDSVIESGVHSITCTLDDEQVAAFAGAKVWSGPIESGQAAVLPGSVRVEKPGWHQLRCFVLNNLYTLKDLDTLSHSYPINSLYIYKEAP